MFFYDALMYAKIIDESSQNWQDYLGWTNHLSYNYYGNFFWKLIKITTGNKIDGYTALQIMNSFFGATTIGIFYILLRHFTSNSFVSIIFSLLYGFSYSFWYRATDGQVYPPSIFWLTINFILILSYIKKSSNIKLIIISITAGLAILAHQGNIFFIPVIIAGILLSHTTSRLKKILLCLSLTSIILIFSYIYVFIFQYKNIISSSLKNTNSIEYNFKVIFNWLLGNAGNYTPQTNKYHNDYWEFKFTTIFTVLKSLKWSMWYSKGTYYKFGSPSFTGNILSIISQLIFVIIGIYLFIKEKIYIKKNVIFILTAVWLIVYILFVSWFNPGNPDYWYQLWIGILLIYACSVKEFLYNKETQLNKKIIIISLLMISIILTSIINFKDGIYPNSKLENNKNYILTEWIKKTTPDESLIIISGLGKTNPLKVYIPYFTNNYYLSFDLLFINYPKNLALNYIYSTIFIGLTYKQNIYFISDIFSKEIDNKLKIWNVSVEEIKKIFNHYEIKFIDKYSDEIKLYKIERKL